MPPTCAAAGSATCRSSRAGHWLPRWVHPCSVRHMPGAEDIATTVNRYLELVAAGRADDVTELYADDATVEDPVGGEVHIGRKAIRGFYTSIENIKSTTEVVTLRVG